MASNNRPTLSITAGLNKQETKRVIQGQLNELGSKLTLTIGVDKNGKGEIKKQVDEYGRLLDVEKAHAQAILKDIKITESAKKKAITSEISDRERVAKVVKKQASQELSEIERVKKAQSELALYKEDLARRITKLSSGKFGNQLDQSAISSIENKGASLQIDNVDDIAKVKMQTKELDSTLKNVALSAQQARTGFTRFKEEIVDSGKKFTQYFLLGGLIVGTINAIKSGIQTIFELDKVLTDLTKVVDISNSELKDFVSSSYALADALGATNIQLIESVTIFSKMGYALDQATQLGQLAVKLQTVGDGMGSMEDTANSLVAVLKGFGVDENSAVAEVTKRVDQLNAVSNAMAVSTGDITAGLQRASAGMAISGNSFEQTTALLTAGTEVLRDSEMVARGLITSSQRVYDQGADALKQYGIETTNANGSIRSTFDILTDLHNIFPTLTEDQQRWTLTQIAGKDQFKTLASIMQNWNAVAKTMDVQMNSNGSATEELNRKLESLEGRINKMINSFSKFWTSAIDNNLIKTVISGITGIVDAFTTLNTASQGTLLPLSLLFIALSKLTKINLATMVAQWILNLTSFETVVGTTTTTVNAFGLSIKGVYALMSVFGAVLLAGSAIYNQYQKDVQKTREETEKFKVAQEQLHETLSKNDSVSAKTVIELESLSAKYEQATLKAKELRAEILAKGGKQGSSEYNKLQEEIHKIEARFKELGTTAKDVQSNIDLYNKSVAESKKQNEITAESFDHLSSRLNDSISNYNLLDSAQKEFKENGYLTQATIDAINEKYGKFIDVTKLSGDAILDFIATNKKAITQGIQDDIVKTNSAIEETKKRIEAMKAEMEAYALLTSMKADTAEGLQAEKMYIHGTAVGGALSKLEGILGQLESKRGNLKNTLKELSDVGKDKTKDKTSKSTKDKITLMTAFEKALEANSFATEKLQGQISLLSEEDERRIPLIKEEIKLYQQRQQLLTNEAKRAREEIKTLQSKKNLTDKDKKRIEELNANIRQYSNEWFSLGASINSASKSIIDFGKESKEALTKANIESVDKLKEAIKSLIEQEYEDKINAEKKSIEYAKEQLDIRLKQIEAEKELTDFLNDRADKEKDIKTIDSKILSLQTAANQGDMKAKSELLKLQEERVEKQKSLDELINDRTYEQTKESLQEQYNLYEETSNDRIDKLEDELKEAGTITKRVNAELASYLNGTNTKLYESLITWNSKYGTGMDSDIIGKWNTAIQLLQTYKSQLGSISGVNVGDYETAQNVGVDKYKDESVVAQMKANSAKWFTSTPEERKKLNNENRMLATSIGATFNEKEGRYYKNGVKLYDNGGYKEKGTLGVLGENVEEWVMKDKNILDLTKLGIQQFTQSIPNFSNMQPSFVNSLSSQAPVINFTVNGSIANESDRNAVLNGIKDLAKQVTQTQMDSFRNRGMKPLTRTR